MSLISLFTTSLARQSVIFYFGSIFLSFGRYLWHLLLLKTLPPNAYGEFLSYISLIYLVTIPAGALSTLINQLASFYYAKNQQSNLNRFYYTLLRLFVAPSLVLGLIIILLATPIAKIFSASSLAFLVLGAYVPLNLFGTITRSYLPALQDFNFSLFLAFIEIVFTLLLTWIFLGLGAKGAILALFLAALITLFIGFIRLKKELFPPNFRPLKIPSLRHYFTHSFIFSAGIQAFMSTDILLARIYLPPTISGYYSALSILGRTVFFALTPLSNLLLPIAAHRHASRRSSSSVFLKLLIPTIGFGLIATLVFSVFPTPIIRLFSGAAYFPIAPYLGLMAASMFIFAINNLFLAYFLALRLTSSTYRLLVISLLQPILLFFFHSSLIQFVGLNLGLQIILAISLTFFYCGHRKSLAA